MANKNARCSSKREFYELICELEFEFDKKQRFDARNALKIAKYILINYKEFAKANAKYVQVSEFKLQKLENSSE